MWPKKATKCQPCDTEEEHSETKFDGSDSDLDIQQGDCPDEIHATRIFREKIFSTDTRGETWVQCFQCKM